MTKITKKICFALCLFAGILFSVFAGASISVSADDSVPAAYSFKMVEAASLRLSSTNKGMRFCAEIDCNTYNSVSETEGGYFGMIIIPDVYRTTYSDKLSENGDYITVLKSEGATLLDVDHILPYAYDADDDGITDFYRMNGVISNVKYNNLNRDFVGIAYYYTPDGGYTYVENVANAPVRNVYEIAMRALYDTEKTYTDVQLSVLDEYKLLAEWQAVGSEQPDDDAVAKYQADMKVNRNSFDGATVDFDAPESISLASAGIYFGNKPSGLEIVTENDNSYLTFDANYASVNISFPKPVKVYSDTVITLKVKGVAQNDGSWFKLQKYGAINTAGKNLSSYGYVSSESWTTAKVPARDLGYSVGDVLNGVQLQFAGKDSSKACVDYITVTSTEAVRVKLEKGLTGKQVANFDDPDYDKFVTYSGSSTVGNIENGVLTVTSSNWAVQTIKFIMPKTVANGDFIIIRLQANGRVTMRQKDTSKVVELIHSDYKNNYPAVGFSNEMQTVYVPVYMLGYEVNETIDSVKMGWHNQNEGTFSIDYIEYHSANLTNNVVADYTDETLGVALASYQPYFYYTLSGSSPYAYGKTENIEYDGEKSATVIIATSDWKSFRLMLQTPVTVTETTKFTIRLSCSETGSNTSQFRLRGLVKDDGTYNQLNPTGSDNFVSAMMLNGNFYDVSFMATKVCNVGETVSYLEFRMCIGSVAVQTITVTEAA